MRIDNLTIGDIVTLRFHPGAGTLTDKEPYDESAVFLGMEGTGDDRQAWFAQGMSNKKLYKWSAYRHGGKWVFGSSAERLSLISVGE